MKKKNKKQAYMFPVTCLVPVTVYFEEVGKTEKEAREKVKKQFLEGNKIGNVDQQHAFREELKEESRDHFFLCAKVKIWKGDPASEFHSPRDCKICKELEAPLGSESKVFGKKKRKVKSRK